MMLGEHRVIAQIPVADMERARRFYTDVLNVKPGVEMPGGIMMECADGTSLFLYQTPSAGKAHHTLATWKVDYLRSEMDALQANGVTFEEYDMPPHIVTKNGVVTTDGVSAAWFKDSEGNILGIVQTD